MGDSCRHRDSWVVSGGYLMWCPDCGAIMSMRQELDGSWSYRWKRWLKPQGQDKAWAAHKRLEDGAKVR